MNNELIEKAAQSANLLIQDLRSIHKCLCLDAPDMTQRFAEAKARELLVKAAELERELKSLAA